MRIVHVAHAGVHPHSGLLTVIVQATRALAARGHRVEILRLGVATGSVGEVLADAEAGGVGIRRVAVENPFRLGRAARFVLHDLDADLVHLHGVFGPRNNLVARALHVPYVISPHGGYAPESLAYHPFRKRLFRHLLELPMLQRSAGVFALTEVEASEVRSFGVQRPVVVVSNGVEPAPDVLDPAGLRRELAIPDGDRIALYLGRLDVREKRLEAMVRALPAAPRWHVVLLGSDFRGQMDALQALVTELGVKDRLHVPPPRRARPLFEAVAGSDVVVLLSRSEGMSMAMLDAFAVGRPLVVSPEVEHRARVAEQAAGWCVAPDALGQLLHELDPSQAEARGLNARALGEALTWDHVIDQWIRGYEHVLASLIRR
ncbi:MAG: glycosyltransferase [Acidimicrobiales bacterium]